MKLKEITEEQRKMYKELILLLREIDSTEKFFMGIYHELYTHKEKVEMLQWLKEANHPTKMDAESKALEITEPRHAIIRKIGDSIGKKVDIIYNDDRQFSGYLWEHSFAEESDIGEESITLSPLDTIIY